MVFIGIDMRKINKIIDYHMKNFITKIKEEVGIDKITHFFAGATPIPPLTHGVDFTIS